MAGLFTEPAVIIVKHNNPCGIGRGADLAEAYRRAFATDPVSAFGSVIALNRPADGALADAMADLFVEVLLAPGFDEAAYDRAMDQFPWPVVTCWYYIMKLEARVLSVFCDSTVNSSSGGSV